MILWNDGQPGSMFHNLLRMSRCQQDSCSRHDILYRGLSMDLLIPMTLCSIPKFWGMLIWYSLTKRTYPVVSWCIMCMMLHVHSIHVAYQRCLTSSFVVEQKHPALSCLLAEAGTTRWNANADGYSCWGHPKVESNHPDIQPASTSVVCVFVDSITFHPVKKRCLVEKCCWLCTGNVTRNSTQIVSYTHTQNSNGEDQTSPIFQFHVA